MLTETDSRGKVKAHTYEPARGLLLGTSYSDNTTPRAYTYNHLGQLTLVTDAAGVRTLSYNAYGEQESDSLAADNVTLIITDRGCLQIAALDLTRSAHPTHGTPTAGISLCFTPVVPWYSDELNNYVTL